MSRWGMVQFYEVVMTRVSVPQRSNPLQELYRRREELREYEQLNPEVGPEIKELNVKIRSYEKALKKNSNL